MYHFITIACFLVALVCYVSGASSGAIVLFLLGTAMELVGWTRIVRRRRR